MVKNVCLHTTDFKTELGMAPGNRHKWFVLWIEALVKLPDILTEETWILGQHDFQYLINISSVHLA